MTEQPTAFALIADQPGVYLSRGEVSGEEILAFAKDLLRQRFERGVAITSPDSCKDYLIAEFASLEHEEFSCLWLDNRHRILGLETLFRGTIDGANVYPREVIKAALAVNAAAVVLCHNHPSGHPEPSQADRALTRKLTDAFKLVDIRVLDHIVVGGAESVSFSERGLL